MLKGEMEVLTDAKSKELVWREGDEMYYKEGVPDPDYCVLRFAAFSGRYYSNFKSEDFIVGRILLGEFRSYSIYSFICSTS